MRFFIFTLMVFFSAHAFAAEKIRAVATIFPIYDFARIVGGDDAVVSMLLPPGAESHSFEPRPSDVLTIAKSDLFFHAGVSMEPWAVEIADGAAATSVYVVDVSKGIALVDDDPHYWLDLSYAQVMVDTIANAFAEKDPLRANAFRERSTVLKTELARLDAEAKALFAQCDRKVILYGGHNAFSYFARRYRLIERSPYEGFSPDAEPTPKALMQLSNAVKETHSTVLYYEEMADPKVARIIRDETGVSLVMLHGAHNVSKEERARGVTFVSIIEDDLQKLKAGLSCK